MAVGTERHRRTSLLRVPALQHLRTRPAAGRAPAGQWPAHRPIFCRASPVRADLIHAAADEDILCMIGIGDDAVKSRRVKRDTPMNIDSKVKA